MEPFPEIPNLCRHEVAARQPHPEPRLTGNVVRAGWTTLAVLAGTALVLRTADMIPGWLAGVPRGVHLCASLEEAEARTGIGIRGTRKILDSNTFAISEIRTTAKPVQAVALIMRDARGTNQLTLFRSRGGGIPDTLRPPQPAFNEITVALRPGQMTALRAARKDDGSVWQDLEWSDSQGNTALRYNGRTVELLHLAKQLTEVLR
jgi:hypothetical protein